MGYSLSIKQDTKKSKLVFKYLSEIIDTVDRPQYVRGSYQYDKTSYGPKNAFGFDYGGGFTDENRAAMYQFMFDLSMLCGKKGKFYYDRQLLNEPRMRIEEASSFIQGYFDNNEFNEINKFYSEILIKLKEKFNKQ